MDTDAWLASLTESSRARFVEERRVLSYSQYLSLFAEQPGLLGRNGAQYIKSILDHYGTRQLNLHTGRQRRFTLFDAPFDDGRERLIGQEEVQNDVYRILSDFVREGRSSRLVLMHGPNGSAKTSFVQCLARAMVDYSRLDEGALYSFNWIFPKSSYLGKRVGFKSGEGPAPADTYAFLEENEIAARLPGELHDHPIFFLPRGERRAFLEKLRADGKLPAGFRLSDHLLYGDLSPVSRRIFDALLAAYNGDVAQVLAHVQVERYYMSRRYRDGIVTIEPQMHVDANIRQITMDESYGNLPPVLRHISMFETSGDLVDAHRGLVEFSDMLKRPIDAFKYLLGTCENGRITVNGTILYIDVVFLATTNDKYLEAFTRTPDFPSFKGRTELVKVPYIRNYNTERDIYDMQVTTEVAGKHIAPHATYVTALWTVLTRMKKPDPSHYPSSIRDAVEKMTPLEKANLYAEGQPPPGLRSDVARELVGHVRAIYEESRDSSSYEGSFGASPREARGLLMTAAHTDEFKCVHPVKVFTEIEGLIKQRSLYEFLQLAPAGEYNAPTVLLNRVKERYGEMVDQEVKQAMGMVTDEDFERLLAKYANHASAYIKKETVMDPVTRKLVPPDEGFMKDMEDRWGAGENRDRAREDFLGRIASFSLDHPGARPSYKQMFAGFFEKLRVAYFEENKSEIVTAIRRVLAYLEGTRQEEADKKQARKVVKYLIDQFGYCEGCIGPALSFLSRQME